MFVLNCHLVEEWKECDGFGFETADEVKKQLKEWNAPNFDNNIEYCNDFPNQSVYMGCYYHYCVGENQRQPHEGLTALFLVNVKVEVTYIGMSITNISYGLFRVCDSNGKNSYVCTDIGHPTQNDTCTCTDWIDMQSIKTCQHIESVKCWQACQ